MRRLQDHIRTLDRPGTERQIGNGKNRKECLTSLVGETAAEIRHLLAELGAPIDTISDSDVQQTLSALQEDLQLGDRVNAQLVAALERHSSLSACISQCDEAAERHLQSENKHAELAHKLPLLKADCSDILAEDWLNKLIDTSIEILGLDGKNPEPWEPSFKLLCTEDHPRVLEDAIKYAKERLIIISPWAGTGAIEIVSLVKDALNRGVQVYIGCGLEDQNGGDELRNA